MSSYYFIFNLTSLVASLVDFTIQMSFRANLFSENGNNLKLKEISSDSFVTFKIDTFNQVCSEGKKCFVASIEDDPQSTSKI